MKSVHALSRYCAIPLLCLTFLFLCMGQAAPQAAPDDAAPPTPRLVPAIPPAVVGMNMHPERYDEKNAEMHFIKAKELGITQVRLNVEWSAMEREKGKWDFRVMDRNIAMAKKYGMKVLAVLSYNTPWNASCPEPAGMENKSMPADMNAWGNYVKVMAERYKDDITWWEIWNEENSWLIGPYQEHPEQRFSDYRELLRVAQTTLKKVNPKNLVVFGGIAREKDWWKIMDAYYRAGAPAYCDVMAIHLYPGGVSALVPEWYPRFIDEILAIMARYGDAEKPVWVTEAGYWVPDDLKPDEPRPELSVTEQQQAEYLADLILVPLARPQIQKVFFHALWYDDAHGLYRKDWSPKPAAHQMKQLLNP